ncbi:MAG: DNA repair protein RecN [Cytophagales bacterium]
MLKSLQIKNFILIDSLEWQPEQGFNIITGETGAGKSIVLGALGLLTGARADSKSLLNEEEKCVVEGIFELENYNLKSIFIDNDIDYEPVTSIRREINPAGKSRAFINDTPVNLEILKEITDSLLDIHSQHDNLLLGKSDFQLRLIDAFAQNEKILVSYLQNFVVYRKLKKKLVELTNSAKNSQKEYDYDSFLLNELVESKLKIGEQENLETEYNVLQNAEEIKQKLTESVLSLTENEISASNLLNNVISNLNQLSKFSTDFDIYKSRMIASFEELKDISKELARIEEKTEANPAKSIEIRNRLDLIYKLEKKHGAASINDLLDLQNELQTKINAFQNIDIEIESTTASLNTLVIVLESEAKMLTERRKSVFQPLEKQLSSLLADLGMPNAVFTIQHASIDFTETGIDKMQMLFSANKGLAPVPLKNAASGGEFSRLMFALKYVMAEKSALPTLIFDEIDTGISGEIAVKMGEMMKKMALGHQIITITHLHTIAAKGNAHYFVYKQDGIARTNTKLKKLSEIERINEIAQMIGGKNPSTLAYESAKELITNN